MGEVQNVRATHRPLRINRYSNIPRIAPRKTTDGPLRLSALLKVDARGIPGRDSSGKGVFQERYDRLGVPVQPTSYRGGGARLDFRTGAFDRSAISPRTRYVSERDGLGNAQGAPCK
jgi:hypothetical protein